MVLFLVLVCWFADEFWNLQSKYMKKAVTNTQKTRMPRSPIICIHI